MSVKVIDNTQTLKIKFSRGANLALRFALDDIDREARKITPYSGAIRSRGGKSFTGGGHLRDSLLKSVSGHKGKITWNKRYAAAQEAGQTRGFPIRKYTTPGTGPKYAEKSVKKVTDRGFHTYLRKAGL